VADAESFRKVVAMTSGIGNKIVFFQNFTYEKLIILLVSLRKKRLFGLSWETWWIYIYIIYIYGV